MGDNSKEILNKLFLYSYMKGNLVFLDLSFQVGFENFSRDMKKDSQNLRMLTHTILKNGKLEV